LAPGSLFVVTRRSRCPGGTYVVSCDVASIVNNNMACVNRKTVKIIVIVDEKLEDA
jgi:hypothetical protein